ncbi:beta-lactamase family protein [Saccharothrix sp. SC076]|nr:beta-lactamase family protein [Saccharothrix obliqua]
MTCVALVAVTLLGSTGVVAQADIGTRLQQDADRLLGYGAPGVLVRLDTPDRAYRVRGGVGDRVAGTPVPWGARFRIGSLTKTFVATAVLQLVGEGRLSLDDAVANLLPGVVTGGHDGGRVTLRQLLQHTSGIADYTRRLDDLETREGFQRHRFRHLVPRDLVGLAMTLPPDFAPGTDWGYSNTNYVLAGMILEEVTGRRWREEVHARVLAPLGLRNTSTPGAVPVLPPPHARGYHRFAAGEPEVDVTVMNPSWADAAGEIVSTAEDVNRFLRALVRGELLAPAQLAEMRTTVPARRFEAVWPGVRYGLGLLWIPNSCGGSWAHGGDIHGFRTRNGVSPDGSRSVVVSLNTDNPARPGPGVPPPTGDVSAALVDHALCG